VDNERFDRLAKQLATGANRRGILKGLFGGAAVVAAGGLTRQSVAADHITTHCIETPGKYCNPTINQADHQCCASANLVCQVDPAHAANNKCVCTPHNFNCGGQCINESHCCAADPTKGVQCGQYEECSGGSCQCIAGFARCNGRGPCISTVHCCPGDSHFQTGECPTTTTTPPVVGCTAEERECKGTGKKADVVKCCPKSAVCDTSPSGEPNCRKKEDTQVKKQGINRRKHRS